MEETFLHKTESICANCKKLIPAELWKIDEQIVMRKGCPEHGQQDIVISTHAGWFENVMSYDARLNPPKEPKVPVKNGCPFDCGSCSYHEQQMFLPIVPITSGCNLSCPICYTHNKNEDAYQMTEEELRGIIGHLRQMIPGKRIINITGGEPTQHPDYVRLLELCYEEGIHRITLSTHGLNFLGDNEDLLRKLAEIDVRVILSFDSFEEKINRQMLGGNFLTGKMRVVEQLEAHDICTSLLAVVAKDVNNHEVGDFVKLSLEKDFIQSLEMHTMTYTGQYGIHFDRKTRYGTYDLLKDIEEQTDGNIRISDFVPSPCAHPLCYQVCYLMRMEDDGWLPMLRFMPPEDLRDLVSDSLYMEPDPRTERKLQDVINRIWAGDIECEDDEAVLSGLKYLVTKLFAPGITYEERLAISERSFKAIYIHTHMDDENFDVDRIRQCCVSIVEPDGRTIPSCAYNVLYRDRDERYMKQPHPPIQSLAPGQFKKPTE